MKKILLLLVVTTGMIFGCNAKQNSDNKADQSANKTRETIQQQQDETALTDTYWKLASLQGTAVPEHDDQREAHIVLKNDSLKVTGSGGCNVLNGTYELGDNNRISFSKMATTMMACPDMETEQQFLKVFEKVETYRMKGDTLLFSDSNGNTLATLVSAPDKEKQP